jgi:hypothetical protein
VAELAEKNKNYHAKLKQAKMVDSMNQKKLVELNRETADSAICIRELRKELEISKKNRNRVDPFAFNPDNATNLQEPEEDNDRIVIDYTNRKKDRVKNNIDDDSDNDNRNNHENNNENEIKDGDYRFDLDSVCSEYSEAFSYINTRELARKLNEYRQRFDLSMRGLADKMSMTPFSVSTLIRKPEPWTGLHWHKKAIYRKLQAWYIKHEHDAPPAGVDTAEASRRILAILARLRVPWHHFASNNLNISKRKFEELVIKPVPWQALGSFEKSRFRCIQKWANASDEELYRLKKNFKRSREAAKKSRKNRNF